MAGHCSCSELSGSPTDGKVSDMVTIKGEQGNFSHNLATASERAAKIAARKLLKYH